MTALYEKFFYLVRPYAQEPEIKLQRAVKDAVIRFCEISRAWEFESTISVAVGTSTYAFTGLPAETEVEAIKYAAIDGYEIFARSPTWLDDHVNDWRITPGIPGFYFGNAEKSNIILVPPPVAVAALTVKLALKPTDTSTGCADFLYDDYRGPIADGALSWLVQDKNLATRHELSFMDAAKYASFHAAKGFSTAPLRTRGLYK